MTSHLTLEPIGTIRTPFSSKYDAPRQPGTARKRSEGTITLVAGKNFEQALEDLQGFDYVWVLFWFDQARGWKPKVLPPVSDRKKRGLFATRSPHRPNPIGLSLLKLLSIRGRTIRVENPDMLDGTPILDLKPYLPHVESHPRARAGWIGSTHEKTSRPYRVVFGSVVKQQMEAVPELEWNELESYVSSTLSLDPRPHAYRRIKQLTDGSWEIAVKRWRFNFRITGKRVNVIGAHHV